MLGISFNYKHRFSSLLPKSEENPKSSQDALELDLPGPPYESQPDNADASYEAQETNVTGSIAKTEKRLNGILDELLSKNSEDLDGDGALSLLQERLKIKPIDPGKVSLPDFGRTDFHGFGRTDFMALGEKLPMPRKTLSNISNLAKRLSGGTHAKKKVGESPISPIAHLLKKHSLQSSLLRDPFSPLDVDFSEPRNAYCVDNINRKPPEVTVLKEFSIYGNFESHVENELGRPSTSTSTMDLQTVIPTASDDLADHLLDKNLHREITDTDYQPTGTQNDFTVLLDADRCEAAVLSTRFNSHADDSTQIGGDTGGYVHQPQKVEGMPLETDVPASPQVNMPQLQMVENLYGDQPPLDQPNSMVTEDNPVITPSIAAETVTKKESKKLQTKEHRKVKRPRGDSRELKSLSRRKSFAGGTSFESGVRRNQIIKSRPLQYWKGKRFLFGRVNEGIKRIGVKYISPGKGDGKLKVKPYISDDYKEMLDLVACH